MRPGIGRDPYLGPVCDRWGEAAAADAGWFDDGDPSAPLDDVGWLCTPIDVVQHEARCLTSQDRSHVGPGDPEGARAAGPPPPSPVVLLSTGGFVPVHQGHVAMMEAARRAVDEADDGRRVVGGYLSPAHDDYIRLKCGSVDVPVSERLVRADAVVARTGWLSIDPWEALGRRVAVNYTDVTARLEASLRHHVDPAVEVVYVCGADNARFALAFTERGGCVVVGRPGYDTAVARWRDDHRVAGNPRIRWVGGDDASSSSALRQPPVGAAADGADTSVLSSSGFGPGGEQRPRLTLRLEDERATDALGLSAPTWRRFQDHLCAELEGRVALRTVAIEDQDREAEVAGTLSLDPMLPAEVDVGISRLFDLGGLRPLRHTTRPGSPALEDQLASIPEGAWTLRDDDRATGTTVDFVVANLPDGVTLTTTTFALDPAGAGEVADSRDFLLGTDHGGLVVALPGFGIGRAPYLLPYVDPSVRSGLPGGHALAFSLAVWELNAAAFAGTGLAVADLPPAAARTMTVAGFAPHIRLVDLCHQHAAVLRTLLPRP
jgi:nicotinic acid mononucleotide adenylyltransferase